MTAGNLSVIYRYCMLVCTTFIYALSLENGPLGVLGVLFILYQYNTIIFHSNYIPIRSSAITEGPNNALC